MRQPAQYRQFTIKAIRADCRNPTTAPAQVFLCQLGVPFIVSRDHRKGVWASIEASLYGGRLVNLALLLMTTWMAGAEPALAAGDAPAAAPAAAAPAAPAAAPMAPVASAPVAAPSCGGACCQSNTCDTCSDNCCCKPTLRDRFDAFRHATASCCDCCDCCCKPSFCDRLKAFCNACGCPKPCCTPCCNSGCGSSCGH